MYFPGFQLLKLELFKAITKRLNIILSLTCIQIKVITYHLLELEGKEVIDMRHGLYHAMKLLDGTNIEDDTKMADRLEIIFDKVEMISE